MSSDRLEELRDILFKEIENVQSDPSNTHTDRAYAVKALAETILGIEATRLAAQDP